jgi:hypothetical protein
MFFLGLILFDPQLHSDEERAEGLHLVRKAADRGHVPAMKALCVYYKDLSHFKPAEVKHWEQEIAEAEILAASATLIDPTGGKASKGDPEVPESSLRLPSVPTSFRIVQ